MDVYKVGISIALANGVSPVLAVISRGLLGVNTKVRDIENNFTKWKIAVGGAAAAMGGAAMLSGMGKLVSAGREIVHQQELMKIAGMDNKAIAEATAKAYETSAKVQTTTISENLKHLRELRYAFGHINMAENYIGQVAKANAILNSVKGGGADQVWELVKSLEQKGETVNPAAFMRYVDIMTKAVISSGGRVTPQQFFQAFKYGRTSMLGWDATFVGQYLPRLIQSMSGGGGGGSSGTGGPGNALMSAFAKVVQGQMPKTAAEQFAALGLADHISHIKGSAQSQILVHGRALFQKNPYEWVQQVLMPALKAHGITSQSGIIETISRLFPVRTASQVIAEMGLQGRFHEGANSPFEKDARLARAAAATSPAYSALIGHDPTTIMKAFREQWTALLQAMGSPLVGPAMSAMKDVTGVLTSLGQLVGAHPQAMKIAGEGLVALSAGVVALGGTAVIAAAAAFAPVTAGLLGVGTAIAALGAFNWKYIKGGFAALNGGIDELASGLNRAVNAVMSFASKLSQLPAMLEHLLPSWLGGAVHKTAFHPGTGTIRPQPISLNLNIDGRTIASAMVEQIAQLTGYPLGAPAFDSSSRWQDGDSYSGDI